MYGATACASLHHAPIDLGAFEIARPPPWQDIEDDSALVARVVHVMVAADSDEQHRVLDVLQAALVRCAEGERGMGEG